MKKLKILSIIFIFIAFLFVHQSNVYCIALEENASIKIAATDISIDNIMSDADDFIADGERNSEIDNEELGNISGSLYNLFLGIGIIVAVVVGIILGIKYMAGSVEEKADLKQTLIAYIVSCIVIFGAFGIWKLVVNILSSL